jgi:hypothetical protein
MMMLLQAVVPNQLDKFGTLSLATYFVLERFLLDNLDRSSRVHY